MVSFESFLEFPKALRLELIQILIFHIVTSTSASAGVTVYKALKEAQQGGDLRPGDWVAIPGCGGGLGHLAVQYAAAMGYRVVGIDTGSEKKALATKLGAEAFVDFKTSKVSLCWFLVYQSRFTNSLSPLSVQINRTSSRTSRRLPAAMDLTQQLSLLQELLPTSKH